MQYLKIHISISPILKGKTIYLCNPINAHRLVDGELIANQNIEYYLVKADSRYVACVTVCYDSGKLVTASFNTDIAQALEYYDIGTNAVALVGHEGSLYIKTADECVKWNSSNLDNDVPINRQGVSVDSVATQIVSADCQLGSINIYYNLNIDASQIQSTRSSRMLEVPYVSQGNYNICWAAAAASLGQYYTGSQYSNYTAYDLACMVGVGPNGGTMSDATNLLSSFFGIQTTTVNGQMGYGQIINLLQSSTPILAGFYDPVGVGHMVVVCGFDYSYPNTYVKYYIRDPNTSSVQFVIAETAEPIIIDYYYGLEMQWNQAAYRV